MKTKSIKSYRLILLLSVFTIWSHSLAFAQIVIPESYVTDMIGTESEIVLYEAGSSAGLDALVQAIGANQTWNFNLNWTDSTTFVEKTMAFPANVPGANDPNFATADHIVAFTAFPSADIPDTVRVWIFRQMVNGVLFTLGQSSSFDFDEDGTDDLIIQYNDPPSLEVVFPVSFQDQWSDSTGLVTVFNGQAFLGSIMTSTTEVNGWGTIDSQFTSQAAKAPVPVLRVQSVERTTIPQTPISDLDGDIEFISLAGFTAEIDLDENGNPEGACFTINRTLVGGGGNTGTAIEREGEPPSTFTLGQNYPNPFNPSTTITFGLSQSTDVSVKVYNLTGQAVATIVDAFMVAGTYTANWQPDALPSGAYVLTMQAGTTSQSRIMIYQK